MNLYVLATSGGQMSGVFVSAKVPSATSARAGAARARPAVLALSRFPSPSAKVRANGTGPGPDLSVCPGPVVSKKWNNQVTRIGQLHVADVSYIEGTYVYTTTADSTVTLGESTSSPNGGFKADGSVGVSNSIGSGGTLPRKDGYVRYVDDHMNFQELNWCGIMWQIEAVPSNGDVLDGTNSPPSNPYGNCHTASGSHGWGIATVPHGDGSSPGTWHSDHTKITSFDAGTTLEGFGLTQHTGYSTDNYIGYSNSSTTTNTYVCGSKVPVQDSFVLYNNPN